MLSKGQVFQQSKESLSALGRSDQSILNFSMVRLVSLQFHTMQDHVVEVLCVAFPKSFFFNDTLGFFLISLDGEGHIKINQWYWMVADFFLSSRAKQFIWGKHLLLIQRSFIICCTGGAMLHTENQLNKYLLEQKSKKHVSLRETIQKKVFQRKGATQKFSIRTANGNMGNRKRHQNLKNNVQRCVAVLGCVNSID